MPVGLSVTLRSDRGYEFLDRLVSIAIPRIRDFRGLNPRSFDGRGNYTLGVKEQIIFPEIDYDAIDQVRGLDITITTSAKTDAEAFALLMAFGMPFSTKWRPKGFDEAIGVESEPTDEDGARVSAPAPAAEEPAGESEDAVAGEDAVAEQAEEAAPESVAGEAESAAPEAQAAESPEAEAEVEQPAEAAPDETEAAETQNVEASATEQQDAPNPNPAPADADTTEKESTD
jgi:hypothetical protein